VPASLQAPCSVLQPCRAQQPGPIQPQFCGATALCAVAATLWTFLVVPPCTCKPVEALGYTQRFGCVQTCRSPILSVVHIPRRTNAVKQVCCPTALAPNMLRFAVTPPLRHHYATATPQVAHCRGVCVLTGSVVDHSTTLAGTTTLWCRLEGLMFV
jgi:hypothetical protein